jgi:hypothetical protein
MFLRNVDSNKTSHAATSQKAFFIVTAVKTSTLTTQREVSLQTTSTKEKLLAFTCNSLANATRRGLLGGTQHSTHFNIIFKVF